MTKKQLLEKIEVLEYNVRVLTDNNQIQYDNIKKYEKKLERLAEIGKATELMFAHGECDNYIGQINKTREGQFVITGEVFGSTEELVEWYRKEVK